MKQIDQGAEKSDFIYKSRAAKVLSSNRNFDNQTVKNMHSVDKNKNHSDLSSPSTLLSSSSSSSSADDKQKIIQSILRGAEIKNDNNNTSKVELPKIVVRDPVIHDSWDHGKYTTYQICIRTTHPAFHLQVSIVRRRFSELIWLANFLKSKNRDAHLLPTPPSRNIFSDRFGQSFMKRRMKDMEKYLNKLAEIDHILSDNAFHLFIQTDLTTTEMTEYFDGKLPDSMLEAAWANMGHIHYNYMLSQPLPQEPEEIVMNEEDDITDLKKISGTTTSGVELTTARPVATANRGGTDTTRSTPSLDDEDKMADSRQMRHLVQVAVEIEAPLVLGEAAWQSESDGSNSGATNMSSSTSSSP
ncbi:sorting nexin-11 [Plakobranchus ocellatus]|uniref:Sorting nexin-11 n=1 Tax=Plakobranchus ocellatus TaxID=259542 RepID=A0AAV3ZJ22_9GAST|nr:sorting nexin-11 [Plakobranchus ocellatus]